MNEFEIDENNIAIWEVFSSISTQFRVDYGKIYAIDYTPYLILAKELNVQIDSIFMKKLNIFEQTSIKIINGNGDSICTSEDKQKCKIQYGNHFDWACKKCKKNPQNRK